jgi:formylglycine-generating enzyme required for sulfatase activity
MTLGAGRLLDLRAHGRTSERDLAAARRHAWALALGAWLAAGCGGAPAVPPPSAAAAAAAPLSLAADDRMIAVPAGRFIAGSTPEERTAACDDFLATAGADTARTERWFEREADRHVVESAGYRIDLMPVTQAQFAEFVAAERVASPPGWIDDRPAPGREDHPVVEVAWPDAGRYCAWRGALRGERRRLPTADELERAARGDGGLPYPWGNGYAPEKLNSAVRGPGDTASVGSYPDGASPYGVLDLAGNVYHWTATRRGDQIVIKGSAWRDFAGLGRGAWFDTRPVATRDAALGFRCAGDAP